MHDYLFLKYLILKTYSNFKGEDDVIMCCVNSNQMNVKRYFNEGKSPKIQIYSGLSHVLIKNENGILNCKFNRTKTINSISNFYNLSNPYYVLLATGDLDGGKKKIEFKIIIINILICLNSNKIFLNIILKN